MYDPMLAKFWAAHKHKIQYPVFVQPKINGVRLLVDAEGNTCSRRHKPLNVPEEVLEELSAFLPLELDGELYLHGFPLSRISGNARRIVNRKQDLPLEYYIFDFFDPVLIFKDRLQILESCFQVFREQFPVSRIKLVPTTIVHKEKQILSLFERYIEQGYEGGIIRINAPYVQGRTDKLLKHKPWTYVNVLVTSTVEGKGKYKGMLGALVVTKDNWSCNVGSGFVDQDRKEIWENRKRIKGKTIKIKYLELTAYGIPYSPIFVDFK
jgi:DNA ligase 1